MAKSRYDPARPSKRGRLLDAAEVAQYIEHHVGSRTRDFDWYFDEAFPLGKLKSLIDGTGPRDDSAKGWIAWLGRERHREEDEYGGSPWDSDFVHWWTTGGNHPEENPIIASQQRGGFGVQDGNHRVAVSHEYGMKTVPVYVGYAR